MFSYYVYTFSVNFSNERPVYNVLETVSTFYKLKICHFIYSNPTNACRRTLSLSLGRVKGKSEGT